MRLLLNLAILLSQYYRRLVKSTSIIVAAIQKNR